MAIDQDAMYARWLQQQEIDSLPGEDLKMIVSQQFLGYDAARVDDYETQAIALGLQDQQQEQCCDEQPMSIEDEPALFTIGQRDTSVSEVDRLSQNMADAVLQEEVAIATRSDEMLARELSENESKRQSMNEAADLSIASSLQQQEVAIVTQNDGLLAMELDTTSKPQTGHDTTAAEELQRQEIEEATRRDEEYARQIQDRDAAYSQQLEEDEALARTFMEKDQNHDPHQNPRHRGNQHQSQVTPVGVHTGLRGAMDMMRGAFQQWTRFPAPGPALGEVARTGDIPTDYDALLELGERIGDAQPQGLQDDQIAALPTQTHRPAPKPAPSSETQGNLPTGNQGDTPAARPADGDEELTECKICFSEFSEGETLRTLPCLHKYHQECIDRWIKTKATCPICNLSLKDELRGIVIS